MQIDCTVRRKINKFLKKNKQINHFSWRYKIFFDYILLNNHRLSTVLFPSIQTRLYVTITILLQICEFLLYEINMFLIDFLVGVVVALILDFNDAFLARYSGGTRFMIFMLETANTRFAGS
jgi:hypothetical protein